MNQTSSRHNMFYLNGWLAAAMLAGAAVLIAMALFSTVGVLAAPLFVFIVLAASGFRIVQPNTALVSTCFGRYSGILSESGFFWIIPLIYQTQSVSLRSGNYVTPTLKVNDAAGTPIEIAAAIVYHISNPAAAVLDVENVHDFMQVQSESALRALATHHPYAAEDTESLTRHSEHILEQFRTRGHQHRRSPLHPSGLRARNRPGHVAQTAGRSGNRRPLRAGARRHRHGGRHRPPARAARYRENERQRKSQAGNQYDDRAAFRRKRCTGVECERRLSRRRSDS